MDFVLTSREYEVGELHAGRLTEEELTPAGKGAFFRRLPARSSPSPKDH
jgi:hypothetical protein